MGITSAERHQCLEIIKSIVYSKSPSEYELNVTPLKNTKLKSVVDYFMESWHPIREQWAKTFKDATFNLGETTNNHLESTFNKIKNVCFKYASLLQFFTEFFSVINSLRNERSHQCLMAPSRKPIALQDLDSDLQSYIEFVTPYAFHHIKEQCELIDKVKIGTQKGTDSFEILTTESDKPIITTTVSCECAFSKRMALPCRHIFKVRQLCRLSLFDGSLVNKCWSLESYKSLSMLRFATESPETDDLGPYYQDITHIDNDEKLKRKNVLSLAQKFRKGPHVAQVLASLASQGGMLTFTERYEQLQTIIKYWQLGRKIIITAADEDKDSQMIQSGRKTAVNNHPVDEHDGLEEYMPDEINEGNEHFRNEEDDQVEHLLTNEDKGKGQLDKGDDGVDRVLDEDVQDEHLLDTESDFESVNKYKKAKGIYSK